MKIKLEEAFKILAKASAVIFEDNVIFPSLDEYGIQGDPENQFMQLVWEDGDCHTNFEEGPNQEVEVIGSSLFMTDFEGDTFQITPLFPKDLEHECNI